jgi:hypothetical protein
MAKAHEDMYEVRSWEMVSGDAEWFAVVRLNFLDVVLDLPCL